MNTRDGFRSHYIIDNILEDKLYYYKNIYCEKPCLEVLQICNNNTQTYNIITMGFGD